jgi:hypothetical protein
VPSLCICESIGNLILSIGVAYLLLLNRRSIFVACAQEDSPGRENGH